MKYEVIPTADGMYYIIDSDAGIVVRVASSFPTATLICEQLNSMNILPEEA